MSDQIIGVDVGGTNLRVGVFSGTKLLWERRFSARLGELCSQASSPQQAQETVIQALAQALEETLEAYPQAVAIGLAFPGFINPANNNLSLSPNIPGLVDVDLVLPLQEKLKRPIALENDALAAAYGEYLHTPPANDETNMIYIGLGTGVGGGLIIDGQPYPGSHGVAMEVGHITVVEGGRLCGCGNRGCLETYASATGVSKSYLEATGESRTAQEIAARTENDQDAREAFHLAGQRLGFACAQIAKILDVKHIRLGGGLIASWSLLEKTFATTLRAHLIAALRNKLTITLSTCQDQAGMIGAANLALTKAKS